MGSIPELGRPPGQGNGSPPQYSCLENPMAGGAWWLQSIQSQRDTTEKLNTEHWKTPVFLLLGYSQQSLQQPHVCIIK